MSLIKFVEFATRMCRVGGVILLWAMCASPLWFYLNRDLSPVVFLPFFVNIYSLHWDFYEAREVDWRVLLYNFCCSSVLSILMLFSLEKGIESISAWVTVGLMTFISIIGGCTFAGIRMKFLVEKIERISILKVTIITVIHAGIVWSLEYSIWRTDYSLIINSTVGALATGSCVLSLVERSDPRRTSTGQPMFWLGLRICLAPLLSGFWVWAIVCTLDLMVLNLFVKNVSCLDGIWLNLKRLQKSGRAFAGFNLVLVSAILIIVLSGPGIATHSDGTISREIHSAEVLLILGKTGHGYNDSDVLRVMDSIESWSEGALRKLKSLAIDRVDSLVLQTGVLATVALLTGGVLIQATGERYTEFRWISVFYFLTAAMTLYFPYTEIDLGFLAGGGLWRQWSLEAMTVVVLCLVGGLSNFFALFKEFVATPSGDIIVRDKYTGSGNLNRAASASIFIVLLGLAGLELISYSGIMTATRAISFGPSSFERCYEEFFPDFITNGTEMAVALSRAPGLCLNFSGRSAPIGLASTLREEMLVACIASLVGASFAFTGLVVPAANEIVLASLGINVCLLVTAVPSRILLLRGYDIDWSVEIEVPLICAINVILLVGLVAMRELRRRPWEFWDNEEDLINDFAGSNFMSYRDMIRARTGSDIGPVDNPESVFAAFHNRRLADLALRKRDEEMPVQG